MAASWVWYDRGLVAGVARTVLGPAAGAYRAATFLRNAMFDRGWLTSHRPHIPVLSVGNLTVGGTGKTPVAAHVVGELERRGARVAVVMRGYGGDETEVHRRLNPHAVVVADADRQRGVRKAHELGADVAVLDDGFQHRRLRRTADIVLVDAERWGLNQRCLPAGPFRESVSGLARASLVLVTQKVADHVTAERVAAEVSARGVAQVGIARVRLAGVRPATAETGARDDADLSTLSGLRILAVSGVGNPGAYEGQLRDVVQFLEAARYPDHHAFTAQDVAELVTRGTRTDVVVCTLKDAVKLGPMWPRNGPRLLYVSQRVEVVAGAEWLERLIDRLMATRSSS